MKLCGLEIGLAQHLFLIAGGAGGWSLGSRDRTGGRRDGARKAI
jgi:hypothetical protein